jgi:hypothetical protein
MAIGIRLATTTNGMGATGRGLLMEARVGSDRVTTAASSSMVIGKENVADRSMIIVGIGTVAVEITTAISRRLRER